MIFLLSCNCIAIVFRNIFLPPLAGLAMSIVFGWQLATWTASLCELSADDSLEKSPPELPPEKQCETSLPPPPTQAPSPPAATASLGEVWSARRCGRLSVDKCDIFAAYRHLVCTHTIQTERERRRRQWGGEERERARAEDIISHLQVGVEWNYAKVASKWPKSRAQQQALRDGEEEEEGEWEVEREIPLEVRLQLTWPMRSCPGLDSTEA